MSAEDEERFRLSNKCWICDELFDVGDDNVRGHCHVIGKYRGSTHWSCNVNLKLTKKVPVTFHNSRSYDSHSIRQVMIKSDVKLNPVPNGLEKYIVFQLTITYFLVATYNL